MTLKDGRGCLTFSDLLLSLRLDTVPGGISGQENIMLAMIDKINVAVKRATLLAEGFTKLDDQFVYFLGVPAEKDRYRGEDYCLPASMYLRAEGDVYVLDVHAESVTLLSTDAPPQVMVVIECIEDALRVAAENKWKNRQGHR